MFAWACLPQILGVDREVVVFFFFFCIFFWVVVVFFFFFFFFFFLFFFFFKQVKAVQISKTISHMNMCLVWIIVC